MPDLFGIAVSPFELAEWQAATNITPDLCMVFESWSRQRSLDHTITKAQELGHRSILVTWEPWEPTAIGVTAEVQGQPQPQWCHQSILAGDHDDYIDLMARSFRDAAKDRPFDVYLRWGHEMNGNWYPWSIDPQGYKAAWKYLRHRMRSERGAWNVKMVWAPNPDLWRTNPADWLNTVLPYWPGPAAVDYLGFTMIEFGGNKHYPVSAFAARFHLARLIFQKPIIAPEVNVALDRAVDWLGDLAGYVTNGTRPLPMLALSQGPSRAEAVGETGDLSWSAATDTGGCEAVRRLVEALHST